MDLVIHGALFILYAMALYLAGEWVVGSLMRLSRLVGIREFVLAFFVMAAAASLPNLFLGVTSALEGIPELSLGDVFGNNIIAMTVAVAAGIFFTRRGFIEVHGETVRTSMLFTIAAAVLPIILIFDGLLSRADALLLIGLFLFYTSWLISRQDMFTKKYNGLNEHHLGVFITHAKNAGWDIAKVIGGIFLIIVSALGIVSSASFFSSYFGLSIVVIGLLIVGLGSALPEIYFSVISAKRGDTSMIIGNLMGAVIIPGTLVLGTVALIHPISIQRVEFMAETRIFLLAAAAMFFIFSTTHKKITRAEGILLLILYALFVGWTIANGQI